MAEKPSKLLTVRCPDCQRLAILSGYRPWCPECRKVVTPKEAR